MSDHVLPQFRSPADQATRDLASDPARLVAFSQLWTGYLDGFTQQSIVGNPWQATNAENTPYYYNPLTTVIPSTAKSLPIQWSAMPGRISAYNASDWDNALTQEQINQLADYGWQPDRTSPERSTFPSIVTDPCTNKAENLEYGPYGPRGWQDEYCEWSVLRDPATNKILRIDFTCENPEYWYTLWRVAPDVVLSLYQTTLGNPSIIMDDLCLKDANGANVVDPSTELPAYNPLNKWNAGPTRTETSGGAMHLTSTPNTLQTEIGLAGAATVQRSSHPNGPDELICCSQYGQPMRNSDPHIGASANALVGKGNAISLSDPPGLYMQQPNFSQYALPASAPASAKASDFWTVLRGVTTLNDMYGTPLPGQFVLHAVYEVPAALGFTVSDITINEAPILYAAQIAATFNMEINATAIPLTGALMSFACMGTPASPAPQPLQMFHTVLWDAYSAAVEPLHPGPALPLASNTVIVPPFVRAGSTSVPLTLICTGVVTGPAGQLPAVTFDGPDAIVATVAGRVGEVTYTVPGNSYPSTSQVLTLEVQVPSTAAPGLRGVAITNFGSTVPQMAPAFLHVVP